MTKRLVDIDDELLAEAKEILGTKTLKATVNTALDDVVRRELRRQFLEQLAAMDGLDLDDPEVMAGAWREDRFISSTPAS